MDSRRRSDGVPGAPGPKNPAMQVVGFRVEGVQPSPENNNFLSSDHRPVGAGSPTPVIIPPTLSTQASRPSAADGAAGKAMPDIMPPAGAASLKPATTAPATALEPSTSHASGTTTPPAQLTGSSSSPDLAGLAAAAASQPKPILQPERSEAAHMGLSRPESKESITESTSVTSGISTNVFSRSDADLHPAAATPTHTPVAPNGQPQATSSSKQQQQAQQQPSGRTSAAGGGAPSQPAVTAAGSGAAASTSGGADKPKSQKEMTKAERRALQEAQRAAKAQAQGGGKPSVAKQTSSAGGPAPSPAAAAVAAKDAASRDLSRSGSGPRKPGDPADRKHTLEGGGASEPGIAAATGKLAKKQQAAKVVSLNSTELFAHLQQYRKVSVHSLLSSRDAAGMHPAVLQLGMRYADGTISGASARCLAMLHTFCQVIQDYTTPAGKSLSRDLTQHLNGIINFLVDCRPLAVSMGNAIKFLKLRISQIDPAMPESEAKEYLIDEIREFIRNRIEQADKWLTQLAVQKVDNNDVILTYAYSHIVATVLLAAREQGKRFRVVVLDARPEYEGKLMLQKLQAAGVACTYAQFNALSFVMRDVTKVFLGASAVMSNGTVMGRAGNAAVAMVAHAHSKPVILCCESFKFHERVQLDAITHNELGDPDALTHVPGRPDATALQDWKATPRLGLLNLKYDAMPAEYVTAIVTEHAMLPPTSVPVIIREYQQYAVEQRGL